MNFSLLPSFPQMSRMSQRLKMSQTPQTPPQEGQRPGDKPAQGNALGKLPHEGQSPERARQRVTPFQGFGFFLRIPRALPWAGLFSHLWCSVMKPAVIEREINTGNQKTYDSE